MVDANPIPYKSHYKLNEICSMLNIKPYVLRFWESEFPEISPEIGQNGEKIYSKKDIEAISQIKKLLFENKYTIEKTKMELYIAQGPAKEEAAEKESTIKLDKILQAKQKIGEILAITNQWKKSL